MTDLQKATATRTADDGRVSSFVVYGDSRDEVNSGIPSTREIYKDARGFYQSVQVSDPDRFRVR
jgi:hypothetical protein